MPEPKVLAQVVQRVEERLPGVAHDVAEDAVTVVFREYSDSRVRDFLPILVEREVLLRLRRGPLSVA